MVFRWVVCIGALVGALLARGTLAADTAQLSVGPPEVDAILYTDDALYLGASAIVPAEASEAAPLPGVPVGTPAEIYYRMDRKTGALTRVATFPPDAKGLSASTISLVNLNRGWPTASITYLVSSEGTIYSLGSLDCGQASNGSRALTLDCKPALQAVQPGEMPTAVEESGSYLFVGTARMVPGTMATTGSRGVLVLSRKDGSLQRNLTQADGLPEDRIKLIRRDPVTGGLWIETPRALTELSPKLEVLRVLYLHIGFDAGGVPSLLMTDEPQYDEPYAVLALKLHVSDFAAYRDAVAAIPTAERGALFTQVFTQGRAAERPVPPGFRPLLPFVVGDLQRDPDPRQSLFALSSLCKFSGPAVKETADRLLAGTRGATGINIWYKVKACADPAVVAAHAPPPQQQGFRGGGMNAVAYAMQNRMTQPDLSIESFSPPLLYWDGMHQVHLQDSTIDDAGGVAGPSLTRYYVSSVLPVDPAHAVAIAERPVQGLGGGSGDTHAMDVMLPSTLAPGLYYVAVCANADHKYPQAFEEDRCRIPRQAPPPLVP